MKKTIIVFAVFCTACAVLFSCTKEVDNQEAEAVEEASGNPSSFEQGDGIYSITLSSPVTKTAYGDTYTDGGHTFYKKIWSSNDKISLNGQESLPLKATDIDDGNKSRATFYFEDPIPTAAAYQVVYPSSAYNPSTDKVTIPANQTFASGNFDKNADIILGYGTDLNAITLSNAVSYLKIKLKKGDYGNFGVKEVKLEASGKKLNGEFDIANGGLALTEPSSTEITSEQAITLDASAINPLLGDSETIFLLAVAPQTLDGGFTVTITDTKNNTMSKTKSSSAELAAGRILAQPAFKFDEYHAIATPDDLLDFAVACSSGDSNYWLVTNNIDMDGKTWPAAGTDDTDDDSFRGVLDGGNKGDDSGFKIRNLVSNTGAFVNYLHADGTIKNVTLTSSCSINYSDAIDSDLYIGAIAGKSHGTITGCFNNAPVTCSSSSYAAPISIGGVVGIQANDNPISNCTNNGDVSCAVGAGTSTIYMGGIAGTVICAESSDKATVTSCTNNGAISRGSLIKNSNSNAIHYVGGIIGWLRVGSSSHTFSSLKNYGNVSGPYYQTATNVPQFVGGLIGAFHGAGSSDGGRVIIENSEVKNCTIKNEYRNNGTDGGASTGGAGYNFQCQNGGAIGMARAIDGNATFDRIIIDNVIVFSSRAFAGGLCGWVRGATIKNCSVVNSQVTGAQLYRAGGIAGCMYTVTVQNCTVKLNKTSELTDQAKGSSLYTGNIHQVGGVVGWLRGTCSITETKVFVNNICQSSPDATKRGFIVGTASGASTKGTIQDCSMGGTIATYDSKTKSFTVTKTLAYNSDITDDIIRGSEADQFITFSGTNTYWDGTL